MTTTKKVILIGLSPEFADFTGWPDLNPEILVTQLKSDEKALQDLGYDAQLCLVDLGATAEDVVKGRLTEKAFDVVMIGAGVRTFASHFFLFEKLVNIAHEYAPQARICFNTKPSDTADAVKRWA